MASTAATPRSRATAMLASHRIQSRWIQSRWNPGTKLSPRLQSSETATSSTRSRSLASKLSSASVSVSSRCHAEPFSTARQCQEAARAGSRVASTIQPMGWGICPKQHQYQHQHQHQHQHQQRQINSKSNDNSSILPKEERIPKCSLPLSVELSLSGQRQSEFMPMISTPMMSSFQRPQINYKPVTNSLSASVYSHRHWHPHNHHGQSMGMSSHANWIIPNRTTTTATTLHATRNFSSFTTISFTNQILSVGPIRNPSLIPLPTTRTTNLFPRNHSTKNGENGKPKTEQPASDPTKGPPSTRNDHHESNKIQEFMDSTVSTVRTNVGSAEATIKKAVEELSTGDLLSVYGIVFLIVTIAVAPSVIRRLQSSDGDNSNMYDIEDPVMDLARMIREEILEKVVNNENEENEEESDSSDENGSSGISRSNTGGRLGLDRIVADLLNSPQIQEAATNLVTKVIQSSQFKTACSILLKELLKDLLDDPDTLKQVVHLLQNAIADEKIKEAAIQLATDIFGDDRVLDELVTLVQRLGMEKQVQNATQALLVESAHNALNDPEILDHSMEFATDVVGDDVVQQTAGEALYNTMSYAFRPALSVFLALTGVGLIFVSLAAFRNVNQSPSDAADRAFLNTIEKYTARLLKIVFLPLDFLVACKDALVTIALFPFRLISFGVTKANNLGKSLLGAFKHWILWLLNLPFDMISSFLWGTKYVFHTACTNLVERLRSLMDAANDSFHGVVLRELVQITSAVLERGKIHWIALNNNVADRAISLERFITQTYRAACSTLDDAFAKLVTVRNHALALYTIPLQKLEDLSAMLVTVRNHALALYTIPLQKLEDLIAKLINFRNSAVATYKASHFQKQGKEYFDELSRGYESLNHYLAVFAFRVEELIRRMAGRV